MLNKYHRMRIWKIAASAEGQRTTLPMHGRAEEQELEIEQIMTGAKREKTMSWKTE